MKKILITLIIIFFSRNNYSFSGDIGIRTGLSFSSFQENTQLIGDLKYLTSLTYGLTFNFIIHKIFILQPEIIYSTKGIIGQSSKEYESDKGVIKLNYIEFPILLKVELIEFKENSFDLFAGPSFGKSLNHSYKYEYNSITNSGVLEFKLDNINEIIETNMNIGIELNYKIFKYLMSLQIKYTKGLNRISNEVGVPAPFRSDYVILKPGVNIDGDNITLIPGIKHKSISITFGVLL